MKQKMVHFQQQLSKKSNKELRLMKSNKILKSTATETMKKVAIMEKKYRMKK